MRRLHYGILASGLMILLSASPLEAILIFRAGYLSQTLSVSEGYNKFLSERYGAKSPRLSGTALSTAFWGRGRWAIGMELDDLSGSIKYKTLNGDNQENKMKLQNTMVFLAFFLGKSGRLEVDVGYGSNKLTREFYGYQDYHITTSNISSQVGTQESSTKGSIQMLQILYRFLGNTFSIEAGGRYSMNKHQIPSSDPRPGYDSKGIPTDLDFDLGGLGLIGTVTYRF